MSLREPGENHTNGYQDGGSEGESGVGPNAAPEVLRDALERSVHQQVALAQLSRLALHTSARELMEAAVEAVRDGLQADTARVLELVRGQVEFVVRAHSGGRRDEPSPCVDATARAASGHALRHNEVIVVDDYDHQPRFERRAWMKREHIRSAINARIPGLKQPYGVLGALARAPSAFGKEDVEFIRTIAHILGEAIERERSEQHRRRMYDELHRVMNDREEMLSIISHDLRSPASAIKLSLEVVRRAVTNPDLAIPPEQVERAIFKANANLDRMMTMMDDLLAVSRAESDVFDIEWEPVDLREVVDEVVDHHAQAVAQSGSQVHVGGLASVQGRWDWMRLEQVVANLLTNALKYGQSNPVAIVLDMDADHAVLSVTDHGRGIPKEHQKRIFERYVRVDHRSADDFADSYGLGLSIVKRIVDALGGTITVDSTPGEGTTFEVRLPLQPRRSGRAQSAPRTP